MPYPITAFGACNSLGADLPSIVGSLRAGRSGLRPPTCVELPFETLVGEVDGLDEQRPPAALVEHDSRLLRLALRGFEGVRAAVARAMARWGAARVALVVGTSTAGMDVTERAFAALRAEGRLPDAFGLNRQHAFHVLTDVLAAVAGMTGPRYVVSTACSSSAKVFATAQRLLAAECVDAVLIGGVDALCALTLHGFHALGILSSTRCRPFAADRDGINIGEGAAFVLLERHAESDVALCGVGETSDAHHMVAPHPEGEGAARAMRLALHAAGVQAGGVDHVNAHGTGTQPNDASEATAIHAVLGARVPVVSTKAYTGHLLGAAGATEAVLGLIAIQQGWLPASLGCAPTDSALRIDVCTEARQLRCRYVLSNSCAFGGSNAAVLLGAVS